MRTIFIISMLALMAMSIPAAAEEPPRSGESVKPLLLTIKTLSVPETTQAAYQRYGDLLPGTSAGVSFEVLHTQEPERFHQTLTFKLLIGGIVVFGGVAAYFKLEADDYFVEYERTGSSSALDKTDTYDLVSGISFGMMQLNVGYLIYRLILSDE